jgi:Flp pilus assembly protein TadG
MKGSGMTSGFRRSRIFANGTSGSASAEFALVLPLFALLTIGLFNMAFLLFAANALHFATERAARCVSLTPASCPVQVATPNLTTYATGQYTGPTLQSATFSLYGSGHTSTTNCGNHVRATGTFRFKTGLLNFNVPIQADACFPA